jgi:hypothetical protein
MVTEEFAVDLDSLLCRKPTSNRRSPVKNTLAWNAVVSCVCEIIRLFSLVFCIAGAVHRLDCGIVYNANT